MAAASIVQTCNVQVLSTLADLKEILKSKKEDVLLQDAITKYNTDTYEKEFFINIFHFVIGSMVYECDFIDPSNPFPRNHEAPIIVRNLVTNPGDSQIAPNLIEYLITNRYIKVNINQVLILIDPQYTTNCKLVGLQSAFPNFVTNPILAFDGQMTNSDKQPVLPYHSILEPIVVTCDISELEMKHIMGSLLFTPVFTTDLIPDTKDKQPAFKNTNILINVMDCTSHIMRHTWVNNNHPSIYQAMPDCFALDSSPQYMPVITYSSNSSNPDKPPIRWANWHLDMEFIPIYQITSPHTYKFLITHYNRFIMEIVMLGFTKLASRMKVTRTYELPSLIDQELPITFTFNFLTLQEFRDYWQSSNSQIKNAFQDAFMSYLDGFFAHNIRRFIDILLNLPNSEIDSSQSVITIAMQYLAEHINQFQKLAAGASDIQPFEFTDDVGLLQSRIGEYLHNAGIHL